MSGAVHSLGWRGAVFALLHVLVVLSWHVVAGPVDLGSRLTMSILGGVLSAVLGGLWLGARVEEGLRGWAPARATMPTEPWTAFRVDLCRGATPIAIAGGAGYIATLVWSGWTDTTGMQVSVAHGVLLATAVAASGVGVWVESLVHARSLALAFGAALWAAPLSAFIWVPAVVAHGRRALEPAVWVSPAAGVLSALGRRNVFHSPALYRSLPYADYGVGLPSAGAEIVALTALGVALLTLRGLAARRAWVRRS